MSGVTKAQLTAWAWEEAPKFGVGGVALSVLHALVRKFNHSTQEATPSVAEVVELTGWSTNTVMRAIRELKRIGLVRVHRRVSPSRVPMPNGHTFRPQWAPVEPQHDAAGETRPIPPLVTIAPVEAPVIVRDPRTIGLEPGHVFARTRRYGERSGVSDAKGRVVPPSATPPTFGRESAEHRAAGVSS